MNKEPLNKVLAVLNGECESSVHDFIENTQNALLLTAMH